ncbi:MAG: AAA family ATPase [bacterium]|nr:AAA family ATPase [bacterium]
MFSKIEIRNFKCFRELEINDLRRINVFVGMNNVGKTALLEALFIHFGRYNPALVLNTYFFRLGSTFPGFLKNINEVPRIFETMFHNFDISEDAIFKADAASDEKSFETSISTKLDKEDYEVVFKFLQSGSSPYQKDGEVVYENIFPFVPFMLVFKYVDKIRGDKKELKYYLVFNSPNQLVLPDFPPGPPFVTIYLSPTIPSNLLDEAQKYTELVLNKVDDNFLEMLREIEPSLRKVSILTLGVYLCYTLILVCLK